MKNSIDQVKVIACVLIIGSHCLPLFDSEVVNYYYGQWFFRCCVPFFFISTGYFFAKMEIERQKSYIKRIALLYVVSTLLYLPLSLRGSAVSIGANIFFGYHHLWYLSALAFGLIVIFFADKVLHNKKNWLILLLVGGYC